MIKKKKLKIKTAKFPFLVTMKQCVCVYVWRYALI